METIIITAWDKEIATLSQDDSYIYCELENDDQKCFSLIKFQHTNFAKESLQDVHNIGLIFDVLSGSYGEDYFNKYYVNTYGKAATVIQRLSFIGDEAIGALEFKPASKYKKNLDKEITLRDFRELSQKVYNGEDNELSYFIARSNSGAGGAKAKGVIEYNPDSKYINITSRNTTQLKKGYVKSIVKFNSKQGSEARQYNDELKLEYIYYLLAKEAGIEMSKSYLEEDEQNNAYFITKRFDINENSQKLHIHSLAGILSHDASSFTMGYEMLFRVGNMLGVPYKSKEQMFKLMAFNLVFANRDDHSRNFSFVMNQNCDWSFAPAYDLTYSASNIGLNHHQLTINKMIVGSPKQLAIKNIAKIADIKNPLKIFEEMIEIKYKYLREYCSKYGIDNQTVESIFIDTKNIDTMFREK